MSEKIIKFANQKLDKSLQEVGSNSFYRGLNGQAHGILFYQVRCASARAVRSPLQNLRIRMANPCYRNDFTWFLVQLVALDVRLELGCDVVFNSGRSGRDLCLYRIAIVFHSLRTINDTRQQAPPQSRADDCVCGSETLISVDIFLPTFNEEPELIRYSIRDAKAVTYPFPTFLQNTLENFRDPDVAWVQTP
ncbi:MAG: hypothetical protein KUG74_04745 [Rhodobacteraceae bacterium]|nr:hypothetical protein [Paracoccaceae bacterium]